MLYNFYDVGKTWDLDIPLTQSQRNNLPFSKELKPKLIITSVGFPVLFTSSNSFIITQLSMLMKSPKNQICLF